MTTWITTIESPVGPLLLMSDGTSLTGLHTENDKHRPALRPEWIRNESAEPFAQTVAQLRDYFGGALTRFDLPLAAQGTEFQITVWRELCNIRFGETISYSELARRIGRPTASRAVGHSNARNPISIIVPCHRVIGADKSLTGYAGGLDRKRALLEHEAKQGARDEGRGERLAKVNSPSARPDTGRGTKLCEPLSHALGKEHRRPFFRQGE